MIYLYAYTNHKSDLDSLRRMGALWKILHGAGIEAELLVNDYRAQLAGREMGLPLATTIETILDVDAVAQYGDKVVIDSPERAPERLRFYRERFRQLLLLDPCEQSEETLDPFAPDYRLVDPVYKNTARTKEERRVLIFHDNDADKELLKDADFFRNLDLELYWGCYFYVKYEELLEEIFPVIHESEEYTDLVSKSRTVVTAMAQTALEAACSGARTVWLREDSAPACMEELLRSLGVAVVRRGDRKALEAALEETKPSAHECGSSPNAWLELLG